MRLSLCMIVRDATESLTACLRSVAPFVDEVIAVDTGSVDDTPSIAASHGARVIHFPWCDSFAAARNESLRHAQGDWILWLDADDVLPEKCGRKLGGWLDQPSAVMGVIVPQVNCPPGEEPTVVDHVKLVRNRADLQFEGRIHEQILPSIRRAGGNVVRSDIYVLHANADYSTEGRARKRERYLRLLELGLADHPDDPFALFNLGMTLNEGGRCAESVTMLERSIELGPPDASYMPGAYALLIDGYRRLEQTRRAAEVCATGRRRFPNDQQLCLHEGLLAYEAGRLRDAIRAYQVVLNSPTSPYFREIPPALHRFKVRHNLALAYLISGKPALAEQEWRTVLSVSGECGPAWEGLTEALQRQSKYRELESVADTLGGYRGQLVRARCALARGKPGAARTLTAGIDCGEDLAAWNSVAQFYFDAGWAPEVEQTLRAALQRWPGDAGLYHNLGVLLAATQRFVEAAVSLQESLDLRPSFPATADQLATIREKLGRAGERNG